MAMFIPEYFTEQAYSVGTDTPEYTHLRYEINEGANMLSAKVVRAVANTVEEQLRQQLTGNYLKVIFDQILNGANGLKEAADCVRLNWQRQRSRQVLALVNCRMDSANPGRECRSLKKGLRL